MTTIPKKNYWRIFFVTIAIGLGLWVFALIYAANRAKEERDALCLVLYASINRGIKNIGTPGTPGYAYYHEHPIELARAKGSNQALLDALPCNPHPKPPPLKETGQ